MDNISRLLLAESLDNWAKSLASKSVCTWEDLVPLLAYASQGDDDLHDLKPNNSLNVSDQLALLSIIKFVSLSKGKFADKIVPFALQYYPISLNHSWSTSNPYSLSYLPADSFMFSFTRRLLECADFKFGMQEQIVSAIQQHLDCLHARVISNNELLERPGFVGLVVIPSIHGILRALVGIEIELSNDLVISLVALLQKFAHVDKKACLSMLEKSKDDETSWDISFHEISGRIESILSDMSSLCLRCVLDLVLKFARVEPKKFHEEWARGSAAIDASPVSVNTTMRSVLNGLVETAYARLKMKPEYKLLCYQLIGVCLVLLQDEKMAETSTRKLSDEMAEDQTANLILCLGLVGINYRDIGLCTAQKFISMIISGRFSKIVQKAVTYEHKQLLRNSISNNLTRLMKRWTNEDDINANLLHCINQISSSTGEENIINLVFIIGRIASEHISEISTQTVVPLFIHLLSEYKDNAEIVKSVLQYLPNLAIGRGSEVFSELVEAMNYMSKVYTTETSNDNLPLIRLISDYQMLIAKRVKQYQQLNEHYLEKLLLLFIEKSTKVVLNASLRIAGKDDFVKNSQLGNFHRELMWILFIIKQCLSNLPVEGIELKKDILQLIKSMWTLIILIGVDDRGEWILYWYQAAQNLAMKTPILIRKGCAKVLMAELETDPLTNNLLNNDQAHVNKRIHQLYDIVLPHKKIDNAKICLFVLQLYYLESLIFDLPKLFRLYQYLMESHNNDELFSVVKLVSEKIIKEFIAKYSNQQELILNQVKFILLQYPNPFDSIQSLVLQHLSLLFDSFPFIIRDVNTLDLVLELLQTLFLAYNDELLGLSNYSYIVNSRNNVFKRIEVSRGLKFRESLLSKYKKYFMSRLIDAMSRSSNDVTCALQAFLSKYKDITIPSNSIHAGYSFIAELQGKKQACRDLVGVSINQLSMQSAYVNNTTRFVELYKQQEFQSGFVEGIKKTTLMLNASPEHLINSIKQELRYVTTASMKKTVVEESKLYEVFFNAAAVLIKEEQLDNELFTLFCFTPAYIFTPSSLKAGVDAWSWFIAQRPDLELRFLNECVDVWEWTIRRSRGIFSQKFNVANTFLKKMNYGSSKIPKEIETSIAYFQPHLIWIQFLSAHYEKYRGTSRDFSSTYLRLIQASIGRKSMQASNHPIARLCFFKLWLLAWKVVKDRRIKDWHREYTLKLKTYEILLAILALPSAWNAYDSKYVSADIECLLEMFRTVNADSQYFEAYNEVQNDPLRYYENDDAEKDKDGFVMDAFMRESENEIYLTKIDKIRNILKIAIEVIQLELHRLLVWYNPTDAKEKNAIFDDTKFRVTKRYDEAFCRPFIRSVWNISPRLAILIAAKGSLPGSAEELEKLVACHSFYCTPFPEAIQFLLRQNSIKKNISALKYLVYWAPTSPITAISFFLPSFHSHPYIIQYGLRSLDCYPVELVFFYVPQIVQSLRHDKHGYAEQFIINTAKISQLFAHQIIWNMNANTGSGEEEEPAENQDPMKPVLQRIIQRIVKSLSGSDKEFYEREFSFFEKVTGISGKLKPFIRRPKSEKKQKIDEELKLIKVDPGVYLPSNPESIVVDIDYKSGRPLQSHAKAPFMATFKIKKATFAAPVVNADPGESRRQSSYESLYMQDDQNDDMFSEDMEEDSTWQSAIFKVGDDCRQDVLALQLIAIFNNIFTGVGLDLYLFPYRIVATAPGCGIIEVVPKSVSRDQMGRSNINNLYQWFLLKYGEENSLQFQKARDAFIKSLAAYSVILYLLQIKDRHNGNVLVDEDGHLVHIDFGYIFDICPGGVKFELSPFKLTKEMVDIMGGPNSPDYKKFVEYCVKAFLATRPYADQICQMVYLMLGSGLPCFKGELTISRLRSRFQLEMSEKLASQYMISLVESSYRAWSTFIYDGYQKLTNGIPY